MSTQTTNNQSVATKEQAEEYIRNALINGKLEMKQACKDLGWSFPRIRSKAKTISKKLGGTFTKDVRGVYFLDTGTNTQPSTSSTIESSAEITEDNTTDNIVEDTIDNPTAEEVETAIMSNLEDSIISEDNNINDDDIDDTD